MGDELRSRGLRFDIGIASTAARVRETIDELAPHGSQLDFPIRFDPQLYLASAERLLELMRELPPEADAVLLVGHNPGLQKLVLDLCGTGGKLAARVADKFPTAAVAVTQLKVGEWPEVRPGTGELVDLVYPRDLA